MLLIARNSFLPSIRSSELVAMTRVAALVDVVTMTPRGRIRSLEKYLSVR
jgi:hypothetical protein